MKSELIEQGIINTAPTFPALYLEKNLNLVILFTSVNFGIVVVGNGYYEIGYSSHARNCTDDEWLRLPVGSKVVLTQS